MEMMGFFSTTDSFRGRSLRLLPPATELFWLITDPAGPPALVIALRTVAASSSRSRFSGSGRCRT
eukprot:scaffold356592_cov33-Prasinocladus_malaysianus.AAC.1